MDLNKIIDLLHRAVKSAGPIDHLIKAGTPVMQAVHQQAPELAAAIKEIVAANAPHEATAKPAAAPASHNLPAALTRDEAAEAVAKAIFAPHKVEEHEKAWMDRASQSFG